MRKNLEERKVKTIPTEDLLDLEDWFCRATNSHLRGRVTYRRWGQLFEASWGKIMNVPMRGSGKRRSLRK